jgi:uncharacterized protein YlxW (UPF0749 family)
MGTYEEYVAACGDDHLDVESVVLKARSEKKAERRELAQPKRERSTPGSPAARLRTLERRREELTARVEAAESRVAAIDALFCQPGYFEQTSTDEVAARRRERTALEEEVASLLAEWESLEDEIEQLSA